MKNLKKSLAVLSFSSIVLACTAMALPAAGAASYEPGSGFQEYPPQEYPAPYNGGLRALVGRTQNDLNVASQEERGNKDQRDRYRHTQEHLSTFDRHLTKGKFDKDELDRVIHGVQSVLDRNTLEPQARDALLRDVDELRVARDHRY